MIEVELPDGTILEFPDETSEETMRSAISKLPAQEAAPPPRETTWGEFAGGMLTDLGIGTMRATKSIPDTLSFVLPDAWTDPWSEMFERGIESAEWLKPEAYKAQAQETFLKKNEAGEFEGFQLPSAEALLGTGVQSLPMVPFFLGGAGGTKAAVTAGKSALAARTGQIAKEAGRGSELVGFGATNAAMVAPDQWRQTYKEALAEGMDEEQARQAADWAALQTAQLSFSTGLTGGAAAQKLGIGSSNLPMALLKGFAGEAPFEGLEESGQNIIGDVALGKEPNLTEAADVGLLAAGSGGLPGAGFGGMEYLANRDQQKSLEDLAREIIEGESRRNQQPLNLEIYDEYHDRLDAAREQQQQPVQEPSPENFMQQAIAEAERMAEEQAERRLIERRQQMEQETAPEPPAPPPAPPVPIDTETDDAQQKQWAEQFERTKQLKGVKKDDPTRTLLVSQDTHTPGKYRITFFENGWPTNHMIFDKVGGGSVIDDALKNIDGYEIESEEAPAPTQQQEPERKKGPIPFTYAFDTEKTGLNEEDQSWFFNKQRKDFVAENAQEVEIDPNQIELLATEKRFREKDTGWSSQDMPIVHKKNGQYIIGDGNNRIGAAKLDGKTITVQLIDHDAMQSSSEKSMPEPEPTPEQIEFERTYKETKEIAESEPIPVPKKPMNLLESLAANKVRLDRTKFQGDLSENVNNIRVGNKWLFEGKLLSQDGKGMGPEDLLEFLVEEKFIPEPDPNQPTQYSLNDAVDLLNQAILDPDSVISWEDDVAWENYNNAVRYNDEISRAQSELEWLEQERIDEAEAQEALIAVRFADESQNMTDEEWATALEERWAEYERTATEANNVDQATVQRDSEQTALVPEATAAEENRAAEQAKTAERNRLGEDVVPMEQGEGELFAGNTPGVRPEQTDLVEQAEQQPVNWREDMRERFFANENMSMSVAELEALLADLPQEEGLRTREGARDIELLKESIAEQGIQRPISLSSTKDGKLLIADGTHRLLAARELGLERVPVSLTPNFADYATETTAPGLTYEGGKYDWRDMPEGLPESGMVRQKPEKTGPELADDLIKKAEEKGEWATGGANYDGLEKYGRDEETGIEVRIRFDGNINDYPASGKRRITFWTGDGQISRKAAEQELADAQNAEPKSKLDIAADAAEARLKAKRGTLNTGIDPRDIADLTVIGARMVRDGVVKFEEFSKRMIEKFGEWVRPALEEVWEKVKPKTETKTPKKKPKASRVDKPEGAETSTKNAVTREEREARNADPIFFEFRESNDDLVGRAEQALKDNPNLADEIIQKLNTELDPSISRMDLAVLMIYKTDIRMERRRQGKLMRDMSLSEAERAVAQAKFEETDAINEQIDLASLVAAAVWGGWGQLRSKWIRDDYSLDSQLNVAAAMLGKKPDPEQQKFIEKLVDRIADLEEKLIENQRNKEHEIAQEVMRRVARDMNREARKPQPTVRKKLADTRKSLEEELRADFLRLNDLTSVPELFYKIAKLGAVIMAQGAIEFGTWANELRKSIGERAYKKIEGDLNEIYAASQDQYHEIETESTADGSGEFRLQSPRGKKQELLYEAEALSEVDEALTHKLVYELAKLYVQAGITEENEVMAAVTADLKSFYPDVTEQQVRKLFTEYGQAKFPSQEQDKKRLRELRTLVRLQLSIDRALKGKSPLRTGPQRDPATQEIREKQRILNEAMRKLEQIAPTPNRRNLASVNEQRVRRLENQIKDLEKEIATGEKQNKRSEPLPDSPEVKKLKKKRDALKKRLAEIEAAKKPKLTEDEKYNAMRRKQLQRQLKEVQDRLRNKDYAPKPRKQMPQLDKQNRDLKDQVKQAKMELGEKYAEWRRQDFTWREKVWDNIHQFTSLVRAIKTSYDLSAVLRQGGFYVLAHPRIAIKSFIPMLKALRGDKFAREVNDEILSRPNAHLYEKAKLFLAEQDSAHPTKMEEVYMGRWQRKVPGVAMSGRAYVTFLNKLRADIFDATYDSFKRKGVGLTAEELLDLGDFINNATGRADLGKFNSEAMSTMFFAPRWVVSRFNMILYPARVLGLKAGRNKKAISARLRKKIAWEYLNFLSGTVVLYGLVSFMSYLFGDDDDEPTTFDPRSTDFGKVRVGNTRMDVTAGLSNAIVFTARTILGETMSQRGEIRDLRKIEDNIPYANAVYGDVLARFFRSKLAPIPSSIWNVLEGQNVVGENYAAGAEIMQEIGLPKEFAESRAGNVLQELLGYGVPLSMADFFDAAEEHGVPKSAVLQIFATFGVSMNTYEIEQAKGKTKGPRPPTPPRPPQPPKP